METRELKFKMWSLASKSMSPAIPLRLLIQCCEEKPLVGKDMVVFLQYSGIKDVFGKEVYEGDICEQVLNGKTYVGEMIFSEKNKGFGILAFTTKDDGNIGLSNNAYVDIKSNSTEGLPKIIGNKYENPELLLKTFNI